jgi:predicted dehydrogenase
VEIVGTDAVVRVPNMWIPDDRAVYEVLRQDGPFGQKVEVVETPGQNQMVHMLDEFAAAVWGEREVSPGPDEAVKTLRVLDALARSAREGREVPV